MASSNAPSTCVPIFTGTHYHVWAVKMKVYLRSLGLWNVVETNEDPPALRANPTLAQLKAYNEDLLKKDKALTCIHSGLADHIFTSIMDLETPKSVWDKIKEIHEGGDRVKKTKLLTLKREFSMLQMKDDELIKDFSNRLMDVVNQIRLYDENLPDAKVVEKVMISVPQRFEAKISAIEESCDMTSLTIADLVSKLEAQEQRVSMRAIEASEGAFLAAHKGVKFSNSLKKAESSNKSKGFFSSSGKFPPCPICKKTNHAEKDCRFMEKGKSKFQCTFCGKSGHTEKFCWTKKKEAKKESQHQANASEENQEEDEHLFMVSHVAEPSHNSVWLVDSGCTSHMTPVAAYFSSLDKSFVTSVKMGNGATVQVHGKGSISVNTPKAENEKQQFYLKLDVVCEHVYHAKDDVSPLWHRRMGHFNLRTLKYMQSNDFVTDLPMLNISDDKCDSCQLGKSHSLPFSLDGVKRANMKLELVHSDLCGPMKTSSMNGSKYFVLFIDDLTRMCWVYFLKSKLNVLSTFKEFKIFVENQSDCKLKVLRTDNGGEYVSNEFNDFYRDSGILHQLIVPRTPQQNGVCERRNRTILEMARCMLFEKHLPKLFWAEVVATAVYLLNRLATKAVDGKTPFEAWSGSKPSVKHLRVFGSICYSHIYANMRSKLDERAWRGIFVGYSSQSKGYRIYNLESKMIVVSRDVIFYEDSYWNWEKNDVQKHELRSIPKELVICKDAANGETSDWFDVAGTTDADEVIKTKSLASVYERCNLVFAEPTSFNDAAKVPEWIDAMKSEIFAIEKNGKEHQVYKLKRALYGLKQAPRAWYYRIDSYLQKLGFQRCVNEATLYLKKEKNADLLVISLYVDDLLVMGSNDKAVSEFKLSMQKEFEMSDLGLMSYFLGMEINQSKAGIFISQNKYALDVLKKFKLESCKGVDSPLPSNLKLSKNDGEKLYDPSIFRSIVGSLLYMTATRPDLMFPATLLSRFLSSPTDVHLGVAKRVLRYVKSTLGEGLNYLKMDNVVLTGYSDSDWAGSLDDMKSTSGYVFNVGSGAICWSSKKQQVVAQSTAEAEYIVAAAAANQAIWLRNLLSDLGFKQESATILLCDNKSAIAIAENPVQHGRTKHINVKFHAIREAEKNSLIKMEFCSSEMQVADLMTKALSRNRMLFLKHELGITNINLKVEC
ncbi:hypothetical protein GQ457_01G033490 [Hibiscus cannabinus]